MDRKDKKEFRDLLLEMKKEKEDVLREYEEELNESNNSENSSYPFHSADLGSDAAMLESLSRNMNDTLNELRMIDEALAKISDNSYGICEMCEKKIPKKRLKAVPYAKLCIECKDEVS